MLARVVSADVEVSAATGVVEIAGSCSTGVFFFGGDGAAFKSHEGHSFNGVSNPKKTIVNTLSIR